MFLKIRFFLLPFIVLLAECTSGNSPLQTIDCPAAPFEMIGLTPGSDIYELNLNWYSSDATTNKKSFVRISDTEDKTVSISQGISGNASECKLYHKVTVKNLTANTKYKYSLSNDSVNWSEAYNYLSPATGAFRFAAVGDPQLTTGNQDSASEYFSVPPTTAKGWEETVNKLAGAKVSFIVSGGDQVNSFASEAEYANFFAPAALRNIPFAPVMGNHDFHDFFAYHFNMPNASQGALDMQANYFYLYNNVLFIALNTAPYPAGKEAAEIYVKIFDNTIKAAKAANSGKYRWIVVHHHKSTRSAAIHAADADIKYYIEAGFEKLMTKHGVDLVLSGHDHVYAISQSDGTVYLSLTTASGLKYYPYYFNPENPPAGIDFYSQKQMPEYTIIDVDGTDMAIKTYGLDGSIVDELTLNPMLEK